MKHTPSCLCGGSRKPMEYRKIVRAVAKNSGPGESGQAYRLESYLWACPECSALEATVEDRIPIRSGR